MKNLGELHRKKMAITEALKSVHAALEADEYKRPFEFVHKNSVKEGAFKSELLNTVVYDCGRRKLGFDPDVVLQHVEKEVYRQFNTLVEQAVKDKSVAELMAIRHELELFMLNDRAESYPKQLAKIEAEIAEIEKGLEPVAEEIKEAVEVLETHVPEILSDKEVSKALKGAKAKKKK